PRTRRPASTPLHCSFDDFFLHDPPPAELSTLSLHDALPICLPNSNGELSLFFGVVIGKGSVALTASATATTYEGIVTNFSSSSEIGRATSELQSQSNLVCRLLLEKKKRAHWSGQFRPCIMLS